MLYQDQSAPEPLSGFIQYRHHGPTLLQWVQHVRRARNRPPEAAVSASAGHGRESGGGPDWLGEETRGVVLVELHPHDDWGRNGLGAGYSAGRLLLHRKGELREGHVVGFGWGFHVM
ncbi:hypothetical protein BT67DRAFT_263338 [Trichocladium antarcticum]|uniref:Uncharacterized protein n=1 Tax=Trichocladium antarcticum TaxID=1450529 RepID=A0AAN6UN76_9PEZI|nr:hypothetical protein BT67DRAFT_263338 [Trichocladium antarcticum]